MRIDLLLLSNDIADRVSWALVDRNARKGSKPSDHAPVFVDVDASG
jgi:exodeoxyribonuclease-3